MHCAKRRTPRCSFNSNNSCLQMKTAPVCRHKCALLACGKLWPGTQGNWKFNQKTCLACCCVSNPRINTCSVSRGFDAGGRHLKWPDNVVPEASHLPWTCYPRVFSTTTSSSIDIFTPAVCLPVLQVSSFAGLLQVFCDVGRLSWIF